MILRNPSFEDFLSNIIAENKRIVVFGVSSLFMTWFPYAGRDAGLLEKVVFAIDNDSSKQGKTIRLGENEETIRIQPVEYLVEFAENNKDRNIVIMIASSYFDVMIAQLDAVEELADVECVVLPLMLMKRTSEKTLWRPIADKQKIPRVINYCWFGRGRMPDLNKRYIDGWHKICPNYEIKEWNEDNYDISKNRYMIEAYEAGKLGYVPDYARIDILYNYGGIYVRRR